MQRNKFQRVQLPRQFGLNGENSVLVSSMQELKHNDFVRQRDGFSVRTFYTNLSLKGVTPHLVTTTKKALFKKAPELFKSGLALIVADKIDAKDCEFRGCIWINDDHTIIVEIALGPGTVRTVTTKGKIDERYKLPSNRHDFYSTGRLTLDSCISQCKNIGLCNVIFEFSYYKISIGWKNEKFICWEITDDGSHKNNLFKE